MLRILKTYMLLIAMCLGTIFHGFFATFAPIAPYLIFTMLLVSYCKVSIKDIRFERFHIYLLIIQLAGSAALYALLAPFNTVVAQGSMICLLAPTATSAVVITGMLGGDMASLTAYSILANLCVAIFAPLYFSVVGSHTDISFIASFLYILKQVGPLLILPLALAFLLDKITPKAHAFIKKRQSVSFYLWAFALTIVIGKTVSFIIAQPATERWIELVIAGCALIICLLQFYFGRKIGTKVGKTVTGGQALGQKNTVLAIWMSHSYLDPIASIGPGAYVIWQNLVNSFQLWYKQRKS
jgi:bile acid:Na+ symporter, BASS family